jgi:hypothetical protein
MKVCLCVACGKILFSLCESHGCLPKPSRHSGSPSAGQRMPVVGVPHVASIRKWCER